MDRAQFEKCAKTGDLIQIFRGGYQHWAIYIGGNEVVHLTSSSDDLGLSCKMMFVDGVKAQVKRQNIWDVVGSDRFEINNLLDDEYEPREQHLIVRDACLMMGQEVQYSVATCNSEHFVTLLRYGTAESRQVQNVVGGVAAVGIGVALGAILLSLLKI